MSVFADWSVPLSTEILRKSVNLRVFYPFRVCYASLMLNFKKMHGLGNDFVIFDGRENNLQLTLEQMQFIGDRKRGIGCDQLVILRHSKNWQETVFLDMFNADGGVIEACGNMTRCVADILMTEDGTDNVILETLNGSLNCWKEDNGLVRVEMGKPKLDAKDIPLSENCDTLHLPLAGDPVAVNVGNPHCVFFVEDIEKVLMGVILSLIGHPMTCRYQ